MSTRSQIIIKDGDDEQWFYRHSDGYPSGNMPCLYKFMKWVAEEKIRNNVEQSCGWLVLIGAEEYKNEYIGGGKSRPKKTLTEPGSDSMSGWKCGAYEPCMPVEHGDIEWLYTINLQNNSISIRGNDQTKTFTFDELKKYENSWNSFEKLWKTEE